jgi:hypothetical protein
MSKIAQVRLPECSLGRQHIDQELGVTYSNPNSNHEVSGIDRTIAIDIKIIGDVEPSRENWSQRDVPSSYMDRNCSAAVSIFRHVSCLSYANLAAMVFELVTQS